MAELGMGFTHLFSTMQSQAGIALPSDDRKHHCQYCGCLLHTIEDGVVVIFPLYSVPSVERLPLECPTENTSLYFTSKPSRVYPAVLNGISLCLTF